jgi:hypothetical protein
VYALFFLALIVVPYTIEYSASAHFFVNGISTSPVAPPESLVPEKNPLRDDGPIVTLSDTVQSEPISEGIIAPVQIEQRGFSTTGNISARTDSMVNTEQSLTIDTDHDWVVSTAEVEVTNLEKLYVINGTFDEGILGYTVNPNGTLLNYPFGWSANSTSSDPDQVQVVSYEESSNRYVSVQNQAKIVNNPQHIYSHIANTAVLWDQTFDVVPYTEDFLLSFSYLYLQGVLSPLFSSNFSLQVFIDEVSIFTIDLPTLSERGTWFNTGSIPINIALPTNTSSFKIGLVIDNTFQVDADEDYDLNGVPDGIVNTQYITVLLDDVSLISATPPSCEAVDLQFLIDDIATPIVGTNGSGYGVLENSSKWQTSPLSFSIQSNSSVSLVYNAILFNHRYLDSTPTTDTSEYGVSYQIEYDQSGSLELFTYLGFIGSYENLTLRIYHPSDWQNFTVFDPFLIDVTSSCTTTIDLIEVPTNLVVDRLGWWKVTCDVYNYAATGSIQKYDVGTTDWVEESVFYTNDKARLSVAIGSMTSNPLLSDTVNFSFYLPNCTLWHETSTVSGILNFADSESVTFGGTNTTAGIWAITYLWTNNTEIAFGCVRFAVHHQASIELLFEEELESSQPVGQPIKVVVRFYDTENGLLLLNDYSLMAGTWVGGTVDFDVNLVKNWWEADFDTTLVGAGNFEVVVNSSAPFFIADPVVFTLKLQYGTELDTPAGPLTPLIYGRSYSFDFFYARVTDGLGIDGATVKISEEGSEWVSVVDNGNGHYNLTLTPLGERDYSIRIIFSKIGYHNQSFVLSFLVDYVPMAVRLISGLSGDEHQLFEIEVAVEETDTDIPVLGANVTLSIVTSAGTIHTIQTMAEHDAGHYTASIIMPPAELPGSSITYSLIIQVSKDNYQMSEEFHDTLVPIVDPGARAFQAIIEYSGPFMFVASGLIVAVVGQRAFARKSKKKHAAAREIEIRFNDANNLLGIIVLHKLSGIPIYSKVLKGGFEEGMLSAFISAILHFRSEFDEVKVNDEFRVLPISDIIRAISTPNLICAFITISSASKEQEAKMIGYARAVGMMLDNDLSERPTEVIDVKTVKTFEWFFDDFVDGGLLRQYQIGETPLSGHFKSLKKVLPEISVNGKFKLDQMIRVLESNGLSEDDAYLLTIDAIEKEIIVPVYSFTDIIDSENGVSE